jgi:hypothetical protein
LQSSSTELGSYPQAATYYSHLQLCSTAAIVTLCGRLTALLVQQRSGCCVFQREKMHS